MTQAELKSALSMLKALGVSRYEDIAGGGFKVEFFASAEAVDVSEEPASETCRCTHAPHEHQNGICIMGCEPSVCAEAKA